MCDARYKWFQALGRYLDAPAWVLELPHPGVEEEATEGVHENNIRFMVEELREFVAFLERLLGKEMDWDRLYEAQRDIEEICRIWHETNELRKARPCPVHSRDFRTCMTGALFPSGNLKELQRTKDNYFYPLDRTVRLEPGQERTLWVRERACELATRYTYRESCLALEC